MKTVKEIKDQIIKLESEREILADPETVDHNTINTTQESIEDIETQINMLKWILK